MAVQPDVSASGQTGRRPLPRPEAEPAVVPLPAPEPPAPEPQAVDEVPPVAVDAADPATGSTSAATGIIADRNSSVPRWLLLLAGLATATVAVAGLRAISWLVAPVFLALVVVIGLAPVQSWLRRVGVPRWLATCVLLLLVWAVLLVFVGLLVLSVAQFAALLPQYSDRAQILLNDVIGRLNDTGLV